MPPLTLTLTGCAAAYGGCAGLLVPRAVHRFAVEPWQPWRSDCPAGHSLPPGIRGWAGRGRCARCTPGTWAHTEGYGPAAAGLAAFCATACSSLAAAVGARPDLAVWLLAAPLALLLAAVDWRVRRLPDVLVAPLAALTVALLGVAALLPGAGGDWPRSLLGGFVLAGLFGVLFLAYPPGLGLGDVKLAFPVGVALGWYGWGPLLAGALLGHLFFAVYGAALIALRRAGRGTAVPLGPFMILGALAGLLLGAY